MDCFYNAYVAHIRHLGLTTTPGTRDIFDAMRSSILPDRTYNWRNNVTNPVSNPITNPIISQFGRTNLGLWKDYDEDLVSDANGMIDGKPWWSELEDEVIDDLFYEDDIGLPFSSTPILDTDEAPRRVTTVVDGGEWKKQGKGLVKDSQYAGWGGWQQPYRTLRFGLTPTSVAPWIARALAEVDGVHVRVQHVSWWNQSTYLQEADTEAEKRVILSTNYGEEVNDPKDITFEPAIYCMVSSKHAQFGIVRPQYGICCLAIQLTVNQNVYTLKQKGE